MSTKTATKTVKSTTTAARSHSKVEDRRRWHKPEGRKDGSIPTKTTMGIGYDTRDALWTYQQELGLSNYDEVVRFMLIEAGYTDLPASM